MNDFLKHLEEQKNHKPTKAEKKAQEDREIMQAFRNYIYAKTPEYQGFIRDGGCDIGYLGSHAKKAGVDYDIAWSSTKEFIEHRYSVDDYDSLKQSFDFFYNLAHEDLKWRRKHFGKKRKQSTKN